MKTMIFLLLLSTVFAGGYLAARRMMVDPFKRLILWNAERHNKYVIDSICHSEAYEQASQFRDWETCDELLAAPLARQLAIQKERQRLQLEQAVRR